MGNAVLWDRKAQIVPHIKHIRYPLQTPSGQCYVRFDDLILVTKKNAVFWDVIPFDSCTNRCFGGTSVLKKPYGVTSQKTAFSSFNFAHAACIILRNISLELTVIVMF
jgi:hypothetical protein